MKFSFVAIASWLLVSLCATPASAEELRLLFLGDEGHHRPLDRAKQLIPILEIRGIHVEYTDRLEDLNPEKLSAYDGLIVYANWTEISPDQEKALLDYVASGKGFVPLHCASYCFLNSPKYVELVGAQFKSHGTGTFDTRVVAPDHPIMKGVWEFETWDETYVHTKHNDDRTVLQVRDESGRAEPWTWVRTHGKGRVFYTAYGHDARTFGHPGFHALVERGIRWACGYDGVVDNGLVLRQDVAPFEYQEANLPNYLPGQAWGAQGDPITTMQKPVSPEESHKHLVVPRDLESHLFAAEPDIRKPICLAWDERGRLWIAETIDYPNEIKPEDEGLDQIKICEDTDGDGRADRFTVFADKLSIPTSICFANGGLVVHQAPHTLFLKDTDGDDRADVREVLFTGWSTGDTHAGPSHMNYGFDNWIWGMVGYAGFNGQVGDESHRFAQGFYRFKPDGSKMEFVRNTNNNSWGVGMTEEGVIFGSTANGNPSVYMPIPNRYYEAVNGWSSRRLENTAISAKFYPITKKVRQVDHFGNYTAAAGHAFYTARLFPSYYWNRTAFVNGPTGHLTAAFLVEPVGSDYVSRSAWNLVASDDEWSAPIMAEVGPDGAVWVIDWYNYIIQHNPTPRGFRTGKGNAYETDLRDKVHGRIYRVVPKGAEVPATPRLDAATPSQLVATLRSDNLFWRRTAQRLLVERGEKDVVPGLIELVRDRSVDAIGLNTAAIHALWTLSGLGALDGSDAAASRAATGALRHPSAGVRRNALATVPRTDESTLALVVDAAALSDDDGQVRLAAFLALAEMPPSAVAGAAIAAALTLPKNAADRWIPDAATSAAARHDVHFLRAVATTKRDSDRTILDITRRVAEHWARRGPTEGVDELLTALTSAQAAVADAVVDGLAAGWQNDVLPQLGDEAGKDVVAVLERLSPNSKGRLLTLASRWNVAGLDELTREVVESLFETIEDRDAEVESRVAAARQLVEFRPRNVEVAEDVLAQIDARATPELATGLLGAVGGSLAPETGQAIVEAYRGMTPSLRKEALEVLLRRGPWTEAMLSGAEEGAVDLALLSLDLKQSLARHPDAKLAARAQKILERKGGLPNADRQKVIDQLHHVTETRGDVANGKKVYEELCSKCHLYQGEGKAIGPDLTGMAAHPKDELIIHILDPNRSVEGNFRQYTAVTKQGRVLSGLLASETRTSIEIIDSNAESHTILREDIIRLDGSQLSLMPEGFEKQTSEQGLIDLLEFLTQRGKYLPLPLDKVATVVSTRGMFFDSDSQVERLIFPDWKPKVFQGVPFHLVDPQGDTKPNVVMLNGPNGRVAPRMPKAVSLPCNSSAKAIHFLSGIGGWNAQGAGRRGLTMIVRLHYEDGETEDHPLYDGVHFADYIGHFEVPGSKLAYKLGSRQVRYLSVEPKRTAKIREIELVKGTDRSAPVVMSVTVETLEN